MAILKTDANNIALTNNSGKTLVRTSGSVIDFKQASTSTETFNIQPGTNYPGSNQFPGLSVSITPKSTSSRLLVMANLTVGLTVANWFSFYLKRYINGSLNFTTPALATFNENGGGAALYSGTNDIITFSYIDHPNSVGTVKYHIGVCASSGNSNVNYDVNLGANNVTNLSQISTMQLLELA